jgi:D-alanine-D-alanine ligase-like ATP-grasp enzyme
VLQPRVHRIRRQCSRAPLDLTRVRVKRQQRTRAAAAKRVPVGVLPERIDSVLGAHGAQEVADRQERRGEARARADNHRRSLSLEPARRGPIASRAKSNGGVRELTVRRGYYLR